MYQTFEVVQVLHPRSSRRCSGVWASCGGLKGQQRREPVIQVLVERAAGNCGGEDSGSVLMELGPGAQLRVSQVLGRG